MRQCYPYQDEQEYSAIQGVEEAMVLRNQIGKDYFSKDME